MQPLKIGSLNLGTTIKFIGITLLSGLILLYVHFQARNLLMGPTVALTDIYTSIQHERSIILKGNAHNIVKLTLNGREIHTDESGEFTQTLVLESGYTIMELKAQDRFGRTTSLVRKYVYVPLST